jgi:hypothetical protein
MALRKMKLNYIIIIATRPIRMLQYIIVFVAFPDWKFDTLYQLACCLLSIAENS